MEEDADVKEERKWNIDLIVDRGLQRTKFSGGVEKDAYKVRWEKEKGQKKAVYTWESVDKISEDIPEYVRFFEAGRQSVLKYLEASAPFPPKAPTTSKISVRDVSQLHSEASGLPNPSWLCTVNADRRPHKTDNCIDKRPQPFRAPLQGNINEEDSGKSKVLDYKRKLRWLFEAARIVSKGVVEALTQLHLGLAFPLQAVTLHKALHRIKTSMTF